MKRVRLRHPETGGEFEARETAIDMYRRSGWEVVPDPQSAEPTGPILDPLPDAKPASRTAKDETAEPNEDQAQQSPRGRRTKKESE